MPMDRKAAAMSAMFAAAAAVSFLQPYLAIPILAAPLLAGSMDSRRALIKGRALDREALRFLRQLASSRDPLASRCRGACRGMAFEAGMNSAVGRMAMGMDASGFSELSAMGSGPLADSARLVRRSMERGDPIDVGIGEAVSRNAYWQELRTRHVGMLSNTSSLTRIGVSVFFPAFAGMCSQISRMGAMGQAPPVSWQFVFVIAAYVCAASTAYALFQKGGKAFTALSMALTGISVFNIAAAIGSLA